jgi:Cys-tRNA synthase (O-phospho-L-seryl-tRNA:Cys-tRNA synthase)
MIMTLLASLPEAEQNLKPGINELDAALMVAEKIDQARGIETLSLEFRQEAG